MTNTGQQANTAIVIAVYNEEASLSTVLTELKDLPDYDVIVVDDCSRDSSRKIARDAGVVMLPLAFQLGAWGAMQCGLRYARSKGYQQVITMDGDGQHHPDQLRLLKEYANNNKELDLVIGSCTVRGSTARHWAWSFFRNASGIDIQDITSGFRLYQRAAIELLTNRQATLLDYQDLGVLLQVHRRGLSIGEVQVSMSPRTDGKSHIFNSWFAVANYMLFTTILAVSKSKLFRRNK